MFEKIFGKKRDDVVLIDEYPSLWPKLNLGKVVQVWRRLGGESEVDRFLHGEIIVVSKWYEKDNIIYLSVPLVNDGKTFDQWNAYLEEKRKRINYYGLSLSWREKDGHGYEKFIDGLTPQIAIAKIAIMRNGIIKDEKQRTIDNFRKEGEKHGLIDINPWFMYCLAEVLDAKDFKAWGFEKIEGVHTALKGESEPQRLEISSYNYHGIALNSGNDRPDLPRTWCGLAFEVKDHNWYGAYEEDE